MKKKLFVSVCALLFFGTTFAQDYIPATSDFKIVQDVSIQLLTKYSNDQLGSVTYALESAKDRYSTYSRLHWLLDQILIQLESEEQKYYFSYDSVSDSYVALIPHLNLRLTLPPDHGLRTCDSCTKENFELMIQDGFSVNKNVVVGDEGVLTILHKNPKSDMKSIVRVMHNFNTDPACNVVSSSLDAENWQVYSIDVELFENSSLYNSQAFHGGIAFCTSWEGQMWYNPNFSTRMIDAQLSYHGVGWMNGGMKVEFIK